jgi:hypothetical protein
MLLAAGTRQGYGTQPARAVPTRRAQRRHTGNWDDDDARPPADRVPGFRSLHILVM